MSDPIINKRDVANSVITRISDRVRVRHVVLASDAIGGGNNGSDGLFKFQFTQQQRRRIVTIVVHV